MGWIVAGLALAVVFMAVLAVKAIVLLGRGIVLLGVAALRAVGWLVR
jgi:hypothetical protein